MRKTLCTAVLAFGLVAVPAIPALACGGLIGPNGAVNLTKTATLAAHHKGVEHYVTAFEYAGGGGKFGSIVPLPAMPSKVERGGDWTLQRLQQETAPPQRASARLRRRALRTCRAQGRRRVRDADRRARHHRPQGRRELGGHLGRRARLPAPARRARRPRLLRRSAARTSWPRCSTRRPPRNVDSRSATARRST